MITFQDRSTNPVDNYRIATILETRVNTANLSREDFINLMHSNLMEANSLHRALADPESIQREKNWEQWKIETTIKYANQFAEKKWKTEKKRNEYVDAKVKEAWVEIEERRKKFEEDLPRLNNLFFDFDPKPDQGIPGVCVLRHDSSDEHLGRCYDELTKYDWWTKAKGWVMKYTCTKTSVHADFRPWIEYILDDETRAEWKAQQKAIDSAITGIVSSPVSMWGIEIG